MRLRSLFTAGVTGVLIVGAAWAGVGLAPVPTAIPGAPGSRTPTTARSLDGANVGIGDDLGPDEALVGAAKVDIKPMPDESKGEVWEHDDAAKCLPMTSGDVEGSLTHAANWRLPWIENTNCIYMGGFGIGPSQPVLGWDDYDADVPAGGENGYGLWARSFAVSRGGGTLVLTILDGEGYNGLYNKLCPSDEACGAHDLAAQLGAELGLDPASFVFSSTHAHSSMDFIGGWGGVPEWYMRQVANAMRTSVREAVGQMVPARLEAGDTLARPYNNERRDTYHSAEDPTVNWIRAVGRDDETVATVATFAAHATSFGSDETVAHADWPGVFAKRVEERFGGIGLAFESGLGNMSAGRNSRGSMGKALADLLPGIGGGTLVTQPDVNVAQTFWDQPVTNTPLMTLGTGGFFDRPFQSASAQITPAKEGSNKPCVSASGVSVHVAATAARIGGVIVTAAPGEIFANFSNTIEEMAPITGLAIGQANDALGYMPQSFETDHAARQGPGFAGGGMFEYEDAYSIDACFGDKTLETQIAMIRALFS
ncbi:MAG: hypothetical protein WDA27_12500 [Actinomycetota bacterium]